MSYETLQYRTSRRERVMKPMFGALAVMAAMATLGLAVVGPASLPHAQPAVTAKAPRVQAQPIEVAISPASIHIVVQRVKTAQTDAPVAPAVDKPRG